MTSAGIRDVARERATRDRFERSCERWSMESRARRRSLARARRSVGPPWMRSHSRAGPARARSSPPTRCRRPRRFARACARWCVCAPGRADEHAPGAGEGERGRAGASQGTLDGVRRSTRSPSARVERLVFHVRDDEREGGTREVRFTLRTTGGDCRNVMKRDLGKLSRRWASNATLSGTRRIGGRFERMRRWRRSDDDGMNTWRRRGRAGAGRRRWRRRIGNNRRDAQSGTRETRDGNALKDLDPALEAIAAVAWLPDVEKDAKEGERKRIVQYEVIPHLVREGWNLKGETWRRFGAATRRKDFVGRYRRRERARGVGDFEAHKEFRENVRTGAGAGMMGVRLCNQ